MASEAKKSKSPYQRYQKTPYVYSEQYRRWRDLAIKFGAQDPRARDAARDHADYLRRVHGSWPKSGDAA